MIKHTYMMKMFFFYLTQTILLSKLWKKFNHMQQNIFALLIIKKSYRKEICQKTCGEGKVKYIAKRRLFFWMEYWIIAFIKLKSTLINATFERTWKTKTRKNEATILIFFSLKKNKAKQYLDKKEKTSLGEKQYNSCNSFKNKQKATQLFITPLFDDSV